MLNSLSTALHLLLCLTSVNAMTFGLEVVLLTKVFNSCNLFSLLTYFNLRYSVKMQECSRHETGLGLKTS